MERIRLNNVLPNVFATRTDISSEIWKSEVTFERNQLYLVEASSGTGKSSMCSYIIGYRHDYSGRICFDEEDVRAFSTSRWTHLRQRSLSHVFQELRLFPELTALENVLIKNQLTGFKSREDILRWFEAFGIPDKADQKVGKMSFGQQQRVAMMRALVQPFDFLLVDEPISHLDDANSQIMADIMMEEAHQQGAGVIVTSIGKHMSIPYDRILHL
ncbi:MAG: ATP-binding cassette domain-containing protein [Bacteroidales bacterium]|nr:ATP-binding cassette domain-containing protein [Candidatus Physcousia equi]